MNALQSRHNIKSLFESSGKSGLLSSHAVFCSMKRLLIFIVVPEGMSEHHMVTPPPPPIVLIHCFYKECYLIDLMVRQKSFSNVKTSPALILGTKTSIKFVKEKCLRQENGRATFSRDIRTTRGDSGK